MCTVSTRSRCCKHCPLYRINGISMACIVLSQPKEMPPGAHRIHGQMTVGLAYSPQNCSKGFRTAPDTHVDGSKSACFLSDAAYNPRIPTSIRATHQPTRSSKPIASCLPFLANLPWLTTAAVPYPLAPMVKAR
jgi:hypothetical protein